LAVLPLSNALPGWSSWPLGGLSDELLLEEVVEFVTPDAKRWPQSSQRVAIHWPIENFECADL
jgi:hypothetical protein